LPPFGSKATPEGLSPTPIVPTTELEAVSMTETDCEKVFVT
jgi:hypothetical protein